MAGGRKAPRHEIAGWERRWCHTYGDFAAGSGVDVVARLVTTGEVPDGVELRPAA
jgi:hypothetical protein